MLIQAESGLASVTGSAAEPGRVGISVCDIATGMFTHAAVLEALLDRARTGIGKAIKGSLFSSMADWMAAPVLYREYAKRAWPRMALAHPILVPYGAYATSDGHLTLVAVQNQREWERFCETVLEHREFADDARVARPVDRIENRDIVDGAINGVFGGLTREELHVRLRAADIAFGGVNTVEDLVDHPALRRITVETEKGPVSHTAPATYVEGETTTYRPVPALDAHGQSIRREFSEGQEQTK
jgi:crotonobetainyl-CoA:carnitine CoA-transferase CaiB-like acyl-CoA transferase